MNLTWASWAWYKNCGWFRLRNGRGIYIAWDQKPMFSEREGYRKVYRLGKLAVEFLSNDF